MCCGVSAAHTMDIRPFISICPFGRHPAFSATRSIPFPDSWWRSQRRSRAVCARNRPPPESAGTARSGRVFQNRRRNPTAPGRGWLRRSHPPHNRGSSDSVGGLEWVPGQNAEWLINGAVRPVMEKVLMSILPRVQWCGNRATTEGC